MEEGISEEHDIQPKEGESQISLPKQKEDQEIVLSARKHVPKESKSKDQIEEEAKNVLKTYANYLSTILSTGRITEGEDKSLQLLRKIHGITQEQHNKLLRKLGWNSEKYDSALKAISEQYVSYLKAILQSKEISKEELHVLEEMRKRLCIDEEGHKEALSSIGLTPKDWHERIKSSYKDERFGKVDATVHVYHEEARGRKKFEKEKREYCRGLFVLPRLHQWFQPDEDEGDPVLWLDGRERTASSTELFYDLIFVAVISKLAQLLADEQSNWFPFVVLYTSVWRVWIANNGYSSRYDTDDLAHKIFYYAQMIGVIAMGLSCEGAFMSGGSQAFALSFIIAEIPVIVMYLWAHFVETRTRTSLLSLVLLLVSLIPWIISTILQKYYFYFWCVGLLCQELIFPIIPFVVVNYSLHIGIKKKWKYHAPIDVQHWAERMGLLVIIVLGESMVAIFTDNGNSSILIWQTMLSSSLCLLIAFSLKWIYFDLQGQPKRQHALQRDIHFAELWTALHWPLSMAITATAAGMIGLLEIIAGEALAPTQVIQVSNNITTEALNDTVVVESPEWIQASDWLLCVSLAITLFCIAIQGFLSLEHHTSLFPYQARVGSRIIIAIIIICSPTFGLNPLSLLGLVAALCFACVLWEMIGSLPNKDEYYGTGEELPEGLSIGNYLKNTRPMALGTMKQDGTLVIDMATMRNGTLVFEPKPMLRKGVAPTVFIQ